MLALTTSLNSGNRSCKDAGAIVCKGASGRGLLTVGGLCLLLLALLSGCSVLPEPVKNLAKSDVDMVTDLHIKQLRSHQRELLRKLYKRNPRELAKAPGQTLTSRLRQLHGSPGDYRFPELQNRTGTDAIQLAFDPAYRGDRVFALTAGIASMLSTAYKDHREVFLLDELDQQVLYDSARNLEAITWRLSNSRDGDGNLYLLSNGVDPRGVPNRSFERLFGKMISLQDMMAAIVAGRTSRTINSVVQRVASATLIPIGI